MRGVAANANSDVVVGGSAWFPIVLVIVLVLGLGLQVGLPGSAGEVQRTITKDDHATIGGISCLVYLGGGIGLISNRNRSRRRSRSIVRWSGAAQ